MASGVGGGTTTGPGDGAAEAWGKSVEFLVDFLIFG